MSRTMYPRLWQMFGACFHQDWDTEGDDWPDLVRNYDQAHSAMELEGAGGEVDRLLAGFADGCELEYDLFEELGCNYDPCPDMGGPTVRLWLGQGAAFLRQCARLAE